MLTLWSGLRPTLIMAMPSTAVYYTAYDDIKSALEVRNPEGSFLHDYSPLVAGGTARTVAATLTSPLELVRTKMQASKSALTIMESLRWEMR